MIRLHVYLIYKKAKRKRKQKESKPTTNMNFNIASEDIIYHILSKCSIVSIMKLYAINHQFITDDMLKLFINNRWAIHIGKNIGNSILSHDYLNFDKNVLTIQKKNANAMISNSSIWATNRIINMKYNNIEDKEVALDDLLLCYDNIYRTNNPRFSKYMKSEEIKIFKRLLGDTFDLNILAYVNIYNIYEMFTSSTVGKTSVFKEKLKGNFIGNFDNCSVLLLSLRSKIPEGILEKVNKKQVSLLLLNKNEMGLKYMGLLNTIFDNCLDVKYHKFRVYIAVQICKFINVFKMKETETHIHHVIDKMRGFLNQLRYRGIPLPEYLYFYATFEISYILSKM